MPLSLLRSPLDRLTLLKPPLSSSIPSSRKHTAASAVGDIHSDVLYLLFLQFTPLLSPPIPLTCLPLTTPLSWLPIPKAFYCDTEATVVVPKYPIPRTHDIFFVLGQRLHRCRRFRGPGSERLLTFGLLNSYLFWWQFAPMTVGCGCLPNLVGDGNVEKSWGANWIPRLFYK